MSGGRGLWGGLKIRLGVIRSKCGIKYWCWGSWGNWGCIFLRKPGLYNRLVHLGMDWYVLNSPAALWEACWGNLQRRLCIVSVWSGSLGEIEFYALSGIMWQIGLLLAERDGMDRPDGPDGKGDGMEGMGIAGAVLGDPPLAIDVRRAEMSSGFNKFHECCRGRRVFVSVQKNSHNTLHTNLNCFYSTR